MNVGESVRAAASVAFWLVALGVTFSACGDTSQTTTVVSVSTTTTSSTTAEPTLPPPEEAVSEVERFYRDLTRRDFVSAWTMLPASVKDEAGSLDHWRKGYRWSVRTVVKGAHVGSVSPDERHVQVAVELESRDTDACSFKNIDQTFAGTWSFSVSGGDWVADDLSITKTGGGTPRLKLADCPGYGGDNGYRALHDRPEGDSYDRPYPDLDCDDVGSNIPVGPSDPNGFDADGDGIGCESG